MNGTGKAYEECQGDARQGERGIGHAKEEPRHLWSANLWMSRRNIVTYTSDELIDDVPAAAKQLLISTILFLRTLASCCWSFRSNPVRIHSSQFIGRMALCLKWNWISPMFTAPTPY